MPSRLSAELAQLARLARDGGLDLSQVSLRVKADLLMTTPNPPQEDLAVFADMALALIPAIDDATALILARKLGGWRHTPPEVLQALKARGGAVLAALLRHGMPFPQPEIEMLAEQGDEDIALALSGRGDLTPTATLLLADRASREIDLALISNPAVPLPRAAVDLLVERSRKDPAYAPGLLARGDVASADLTPLFLKAGPERRTAILESLASLDSLSLPERRPELAPDVLAGWLATATEDPIGAFGTIADRIGADGNLVEALASDASRDLTALALIAAGTSVEDATRFLIRLGDDAAHSVDRIFSLVALMRSTRPSVALRVVMQVAGSPYRQAPRKAIHQPAMDPSGTPVRPGATKLENPSLVADVMRRLGLRREQG